MMNGFIYQMRCNKCIVNYKSLRRMRCDNCIKNTCFWCPKIDNIVIFNGRQSITDGLTCYTAKLIIKTKVKNDI